MNFDIVKTYTEDVVGKRYPMWILFKNGEFSTPIAIINEAEMSILVSRMVAGGLGLEKTVADQIIKNLKGNKAK